MLFDVTGLETCVMVVWKSQTSTLQEGFTEHESPIKHIDQDDSQIMWWCRDTSGLSWVKMDLSDTSVS